MLIRRFEQKDAQEIVSLITRNFLEINIKDYSKEEMDYLVQVYHADKVKQIASYANMYVVCDENKIVGTGSISSFWGSQTESILLTIFVLPEYQRQGIGKQIVQTLEQDELFLRAKRIEIPASKTACMFYEKMGYLYKNGVKELDEENYYRMEKFR